MPPLYHSDHCCISFDLNITEFDSFDRSIDRSIVHSFIHSFIHSNVCSFVLSYVCSFVSFRFVLSKPNVSKGLLFSCKYIIILSNLKKIQRRNF